MYENLQPEDLDTGEYITDGLAPYTPDYPTQQTLYTSDFSIVVMYDAAGLRRAAGKTAATLNRLVKDIFEHSNDAKPYETLKELLWHTPFEVFCGALFGIFIALSIHTLLS